MSLYSWFQRVLACWFCSVFFFSSNISCAVSRKWSVPLRCLESELSPFSVPFVSGLMSRLASHPSIRRVADDPCFRFSLPAKRNGASCSAELGGLFSPVDINSCFWMFGDGTMGRWDDGTMGISRFIFGCWTELVGEATADREETWQTDMREVRKCILVKVSMPIQNIVVKSY